MPDEREDTLRTLRKKKEDWKVIYYMCISKEMKDDTREARNETVRRELIKDGEREREREE